jgi:hypothetical protein
MHNLSNKPGDNKMINIRKALVMYVGIALVPILTCSARAEDYPSDRMSHVDLRVEVLNELNNPVTDNIFVHGQRLFVRGSIFDPGILDALEKLHRAEVMVKAMEAGADPRDPKIATDEISLAKERYENAVVRGKNGSAILEAMQAITFELYNRNDEHIVGRVDVNLSQITDKSRVGVDDMEPDYIQAPFLYEIDSEQLATGQYRLQAASEEYSISEIVDFVIISSAEATDEQRCELAYVDARVAASHGNHERAISLALESIEYGSPLNYNVMASYRLLGDEYSKISEYQQAIDAYNQALDKQLKAQLDE